MLFADSLLQLNHLAVTGNAAVDDRGSQVIDGAAAGDLVV